MRADNLARELGIKRLWVKDDSGNPTHSFKDRVVAVALSARPRARLHGARLPVDRQPRQRRRRGRRPRRHPHRRAHPEGPRAAQDLTTAVYGGTLVAVEGNYDDVNRLASEIAGEQEDWAFVNVNVRPYYAEGSKTLGFEVAEQLGWRLPEQVVIPVASGSQLTKVDKGFAELGRLGLVEPDAVPGLRRAGRPGCSPVAAAFKAGHDVVRPVRPDTIAKSLAIGNPADGPYVLDVARRTGGAVEYVTDDEIREGIRLLARTEGIFAETAGGVTVATLKKLVETGQLDPDAETVVFNTGDGLKTLDAVADRVGPAATIAPATRRSRRPAWSDTVAAGSLQPRSASSRQESHECQRPDPDHPAHLHRRRPRCSADGATLAEVLDALDAATPASRRGSSTTRARCAGSSTSTSTTRTCASPRLSTPAPPTAPRSRSSPRSRGAEGALEALACVAVLTQARGRLVQLRRALVSRSAMRRAAWR